MSKAINHFHVLGAAWPGTILQPRLIRGVLSNAHGVNLLLMIFPRMSLHCKLVPVHYREYENDLFGWCQWHLNTLGSKKSCHFVSPSEVNPKQIVTRSHTFSRALSRLLALALSFEWLVHWIVWVICVWSEFGFGFMECSQSSLGIGDRIREQKSSNDDWVVWPITLLVTNNPKHRFLNRT